MGKPTLFAADPGVDMIYPRIGVSASPIRGPIIPGFGVPMIYSA